MKTFHFVNLIGFTCISVKGFAIFTLIKFKYVLKCYQERRRDRPNEALATLPTG